MIGDEATVQGLGIRSPFSVRLDRISVDLLFEHYGTG